MAEWCPRDPKIGMQSFFGSNTMVEFDSKIPKNFACPSTAAEKTNSLATLDKILWEAVKSGVACIGCKCGQCLMEIQISKGGKVEMKVVSPLNVLPFESWVIVNSKIQLNLIFNFRFQSPIRNGFCRTKNKIKGLFIWDRQITLWVLIPVNN